MANSMACVDVELNNEVCNYINPSLFWNDLQTNNIQKAYSLGFQSVNDVLCNDLENMTSIGNYQVPLTEDFLQSHLLRQRQDIDHLIFNMKEQTRQALEAKREKHTQTLLALIENSVGNLLIAKEEEIQRLTKRSADLESTVKQLIVESQLWQDIARNQDILLSNLRASLDEFSHQSKERNREGYGESMVEDTESCHYGQICGQTFGQMHGQTCGQNFGQTPCQTRPKTVCRVCEVNEVSMLMLPCRHLCLCKECESGVDSCPICESSKNASLQVYMS